MEHRKTSKPSKAKTTLRLADLEQSKNAVLHSLGAASLQEHTAMPSTNSSVGSAPNRAWLCASEHRGETDGWRLQAEGKMRTALVDRERQQGKTRLAGARSWCQQFPANRRCYFGTAALSFW